MKKFFDYLKSIFCSPAFLATLLGTFVGILLYYFLFFICNQHF